MTKYWVGADPGGKGKFGLAFLDEDGKLWCTRVSSVDEAAGTIFGKGEILGLGIDAPMWWSSAEGGGRNADQLLRKKYGIHPGTVQSVNSLRGAALVGGAMLAFRIRQRFREAKITEAHPKALLSGPGPGRDGFPQRFCISSGWPGKDEEDEQDAAIAAICAREGFSGRWITDLAAKQYRHESEQNPDSYWLAPMHYHWPDDLTGVSL